jgi:hypothetical protein
LRSSLPRRIVAPDRTAARRTALERLFGPGAIGVFRSIVPDEEKAMQVVEMLGEIARRVPEGAPAGTRHRVEVDGPAGRGLGRIAVEACVDHRGRRRERFWCDGVRLQRPEFLRLTCAEAECPQVVSMREQWLAFQRRRSGRPVPARAEPFRPQALPLMQEHPLAAAGHRCVARPATFRCLTPCPNGAHPPMWIDKRGWDLFEDGVYIGGGVAPVAGDAGAGGEAGDGLTTRRSAPRIPTLPAAEAYVLARALEAAAVLDPLAGRG